MRTRYLLSCYDMRKKITLQNNDISCSLKSLQQICTLFSYVGIGDVFPNCFFKVIKRSRSSSDLRNFLCSGILSFCNIKIVMSVENIDIEQYYYAHG